MLLRKATATSFLLRYYLHSTPLTTHPKYLILTALFLAAKTENAFIPLQYFKSQLPASVDTSQLTSLEFPLSSGLQFSYTVWSCLRPLWGFGLDIMELVNEGALDLDKESVRKTMDDARQWALESLRTEAQFLFTPPQIALACIFHFDGVLVRDFLANKFPPGRVFSPVKSEPEAVKDGETDAAGKLLDMVVACDILISERLEIIQARSKEDTVKLVTEIDKKLYKCRKQLDAVESEDTAKRKASSPDERPVKKVKAE
jgi:cyclin H